MGIMRPPRKIIYPESDGEPMADNTLQYRWIVTIKEGLERVFPGPDEAFIAGDLFWYPLEGHPEIVLAPDVLIALGRPKGDRGSYLQWEENGIAPQVVFEVLSPSNRAAAMNTKLRFYEKHGVQEYCIYDPDKVELTVYVRDGDEFKKIPEVDGWTSPRLGIRFDLSGRELVIYGPDGQRFLTFQEMADAHDQVVHERDQVVHERDQVVHERDQVVHERDQIVHERDQVVHERDQLTQQLEAERQRNERMAAQLRGMGLEPPP